MASTFLMVVSMVVAVPSNVGVAHADAASDAITDGLGQLSDALVGLDGLDELADLIPLTDVLPTGGDGLELVNALTELLKDQLATVVDAAGVETKLNNLDGTTLPGTNIVVNVAVSVGTSGSTHTVTFTDLRLTRSAHVAELMLASDDIALNGLALTADFSLTAATPGTPLVLTITEGLPASVGIDASSPPVIGLSVAANVDLPVAGLSATLGVGDVTLKGGNLTGPDVSVDANFTATWLDPDSDGTITGTELTTTAPLDLFDVAWASSTATVNLAVTSSLIPGTGTVTLNDADLSDGLDLPSVILGNIGDLSNLSIQDAIQAIAQFSVSLDALQLQLANPDIPLLDQSFSQLVSINEKLQQFFSDAGLVAPGGGPYDFDFTLDGLKTAGLDTIEGLIAKLEDTLITGVADLGLGYSNGALTFTIAKSFGSGDTTDPELKLDLGSQFADVGIIGLDSALAVVTADPTFDLNLTVGIDIASSPIVDDGLGNLSVTPITDRVFIDTTADPEISANVPITANLDLRGHIGLLELSLVTCGDPSPAPTCDTTADTVPLLAAAGTGDMLEINLDGGPDNKISLTELFAALNAPSGVTFNAAGSPPTATISSGDNTLTAKIDVEVPTTNLNASATVGSTPLAEGIVTFELPNLLALVSNPAAFSVTASDFDAFSAFDTDDPEAFFALIVNAVHDLLLELDGLSGDGFDFEIPIVEVNFSDLTAVFAEMATQVQSLVATPAGGLGTLEALIELKIFEVLQSAGFISGAISPPAIPQADAFPNLEAYETALTAFLEVDLPAFLAANADFLNLSFDPGDVSTAPALLLELGFDKSQTITKPFNLDLAELGATSLSSVISAGGSGDVELTYGIDAGLTVGLEIDGLTTPPRPFLLDTSGVSVFADGGLSGGQFEATIGPFGVSIGESGSVAEAGADCANAVDDDGDGLINDGCPEADGDSESGDQCLNNTDDDDDSGSSNEVNDGCPFEFGANAGFRASLDIENDIGGDGLATVERVYFGGSGTQIGTWASGIASSFSFPNPSALGGGPVGTTQCPSLDANKPAVCASLPFFLTAGSTTIFLDEVTLALEGLDPAAWTKPDFTDLIAAIQANAEDLALILLVEGVEAFLTFLGESLDAASYDVDIPVLGDALDAGADIVNTFNNGVVMPVGDAIAAAGGANSDAIDTLLTDALEDALGATGLDILDGPVDIVEVVCNGASPCALSSIDEINVRLEIGQTSEPFTVQPNFDFGVPGLRLDLGETKLSAEGSWSLDVGFGLSRSDGFYILTSDTDISVGADVDLEFGPTPIQGDIAFIQLLVTDGKPVDTPEASITFGLDVTGGGGKLPLSQLLSGPDPISFAPTIEPVIDLVLDIQTQFNVGSDATSNAIPRLLATFELGWNPGNLVTVASPFASLSADFVDVQLDLGSFIAEFLAPALEDINRYLKPIKPVIDTISAPVPGIAQLAELVGEEPPTLLDLFEAVSGNDLTFIRRIIGIIDFITAIDAVASDVMPGGPGCSSLCIDIGEFSLAAQELFAVAKPASQRASLIASSTLDAAVSGAGGVLGAIDNKPAGDFGGGGSAFKSEFSKSRTGGGFSFPAFQNPSQLFELIVGGNPTLVEWRSGILKASFGFSQSFGPIFVGPIPISIVISGSAGVEGQFGIGYDTKGIRQLVEILTEDANSTFFGGVSALLAGVFINDLDENGNDVPEIAFFAEISAGAALDLVIVSAGVEGGVRAEITLNLHDGGFANPPPPENLDGKLRIDEIVSFADNPLCIFDVGGKLTAFLRAFVEIDLFLYSKKFSFTIVNVTLLEFKNLFQDACQPAAPEPAKMVGTNSDILRLNMGPFASERNFASNEEEERFVLRQLDADSVSVTAFGITKDYHGVVRVFGNGGTENDTIILETGVNAQNSGQINPDTGEEIIDNGAAQQQKFTIPAVLCGGSGDDRILGGYGDDRIYGDGNDSGIDPTGLTCPDTNPSNDGNDTVTGNDGADRVFGQGGNDIVTGDAGDDPELRGGEGMDEVVGGAGRDTIYGEGGDDVLLGGPEPEPALNSTAANDIIHGGPGADSIEGDWGDDILNGDGEDDIIVGNQGEDVISGGLGNDRILGNEDNDDIAGNGGDDEILGNDGDDDIYGDDRNLASLATGRDDIVGGPGVDDVWGGPGEDVILGDEGEIFRVQAALGADPFAPPNAETPLFLLQAGPGLGDNLNGGPDDDLIYGQEGGDTINGDGGDDNLHGNAGADIMSGNADADVMFGDAGNDQMYGDSATPNGAADGADTMRGGNDNDTMRGNADGDTMFGDSGDDVMYGDAATPDAVNDGADTMRGGSGNDLVFGNADGDFLFGDGDADRLIGGSSQADEPDGADQMNGNAGPDVMIGDNGTISVGSALNPTDLTQKLVTLRLDDEGAGDTMMGDGSGDRMFGQFGDDEMHGNDGADYLEGNQGSDDMFGDAGADDMVGGSSAADGVIDADRIGTGRPDVGDDMDGGTEADYMAGDNARIDRTFDLGSANALVLFDVNSASTTVSGGDRMHGGDGPDMMFGQGNGAQDPEANPDAPDGFDNDLDGDVDEDGTLSLTVNPWLGDAMFGDAGADYMEGNHGADLMEGGSGNDDMVGGGSAIDGVIDTTRNGTGLKDGRDSMHGDDGIDWMAGDNALVNSDDSTGALVEVVLFDVNNGATNVSSGDYMRGGASDDVMFGQGNGTQGAQSDPLDGVDNDLDNDVDVSSPDEDQPWKGDVMFGDAGDDYMEGNHGSDLMYGDDGTPAEVDDGDDDMVGGGSANDGGNTGTFTATRNGNGLWDKGDVMYGEGGDDWITGDNAFVQRNADLGATEDLVLFDVNSNNASLSGGDYMDGGTDNDRMFGQGNGLQALAQADPLDGVDNDGDGVVDEDQPWAGDVMLGGSGDDAMEGNHGADVMWGDDRNAATADGEDDMVGGGSALDGVIDDDRDGSGLNDRGDVMRGEGGADFMGGDNAWIDRDGNLAVTGLVLPTSTDRGIALFDVEIVGDAAITAFSGGDWMSGGDEPDLMFGQGNGAQPATQADPLDGVDNDFDSREDGDPNDANDQGYDCADNGFDNDGDGDADAADSDCTAASTLDEDNPWAGDLMFGNAGDDYMEGNHGADWMFGNDDEDDMVGGGSANDGLIVPLRTGTDLKDWADVMHGGDEDDVMTGDNARINRVLDGADWQDLETADLLLPPAADGFGPYDITVRLVDMDVVPEQAGAYGDDYMTGDTGNDQMYGQLGSDFAVGNHGDDALVGDLGQIRLNLIGDEADDPSPALIETQSPHWDASVYENGSLLYETELYSFDTSAGGVGGDDVLLGYDGRDTVFGGPGDDVMNGDGDGVEEVLDPDNPAFTDITDIDPATNDEDFLFGGDDDDVMWGGRGDDVGYGGHGEDYLDVRPREETDNGRTGSKFRIIPRDPPSWFTYAFPENFQDADFLYGGWDRDALQGDQAANGPDPGDRLADWAGGFNVFYLCPAGYGDYTVTRMGSPFAQTFLEDLARASGAFGTATEGTSGFRDVAYVFNNQRGDNSNPPHPDHPGHFTCADISNVVP